MLSRSLPRIQGSFPLNTVKSSSAMRPSKWKTVSKTSKSAPTPISKKVDILGIRHMLTGSPWRHHVRPTGNHTEFIRVKALVQRELSRQYHQSSHVHNEKSGRYLRRALGMYGGLFGMSYLTPFMLGTAMMVLLYYLYEYLTIQPENATPEELLLSDNAINFIKLLPTRAGSRAWGWLTHLNIPVPLREPIYKTYSNIFGCILEEADKELKDFDSLNAFFTRRLKEGVRPIASTPMVSPVDGTVLHFGKVDGEWAEQIKGVKYRLQSLLGADATELMKTLQPNGKKANFDQFPNDLHYMVIYLAPGDYHGVHSPANWTVKNSRHFPGHLFSVSPKSSSMIQGLLAVNERVVLNGFWDHGYFSLTPVGAYNVGSITLEFDDKVKTNIAGQIAEGPHTEHVYPGIDAKKGDCLSFFHLGSTVVLLFQAPDNWHWHVRENEKVKLGIPLGSTK